MKGGGENKRIVGSKPLFSVGAARRKRIKRARSRVDQLAVFRSLRDINGSDDVVQLGLGNFGQPDKNPAPHQTGAFKEKGLFAEAAGSYMIAVERNDALILRGSETAKATGKIVVLQDFFCGMLCQRLKRTALGAG